MSSCLRKPDTCRRRLPLLLLTSRIVSQQTRVVLFVVVGVTFEGQRGRVVADPHQEDDDGAEGHHRGDQEETEPVHRASDPAPVVFLL